MTQIPPSSPFGGGSRPGGSQPGGSQPGGSGSGANLHPTPSGFIGRYQILDKIGEGGMGSLHLARDPAIDRLVAIKLLRRGFDTEAVRERFAREARAAGRLRHPNIVTIFDVGEHDGDPFIAMEFLAGETLGELIRHNAGLSLARRLKLLEELCDGLAYAHRAGLVHRDIKPANLMVDAEGVLKILDFGIVRVSDSGMTQAGVLVGTINYMSPEQVLGTGVDHRSDIFAVGLVAYELLSGRQAFVGTLKDGLLHRIPNAEIEPLSSVVPGLDPEVIAIVEHALQKDPADRYQELARMRNDLGRARQRIEIEEERAAALAASASAETAFIAEEVTAPGVPIEPPRGTSPGPLAAAERALAEGNYRFALTMAGRAAALDPQDRTPSTIVARAEQALLERGRTFDSDVAAVPRSTPGAATPVQTPPAGTSPSCAAAAPSTASFQRATYAAIGVAVVALVVAGFAVWSQVARSEPMGTAPPAGSEQARAAGEPNVPATPVERSTESTAPPPAAPPQADSTPDSAPAARQPESTGARGSAPRSSGRAGATSRERTPPGSAEQRRGSTREGAVSTPASEPAAPPATPQVSQLPRSTVNAPATLPGSLGTKPVTPPPPAPPPPKPAPKTDTAKPDAAANTEPPRDPRAEALAAVESVLRRYEAAWEALDITALRQVWLMPNEQAVQSRMRGMREYAMDVSGCFGRSIKLAADARSATASCRVSYDFDAHIGGRQRESVQQTFTLEKRGDNWFITGLR